MPRPILATIDRAALSSNLHTVTTFARQQAPDVFVWAVVKARGYGHGIEATVQGFAAADGLALLDLDEAVACRDRGWTKPILLLEGFFDAADLDIVQMHELSAVVHCEEQLHLLERVRPRSPLKIWLKLNSGMHRLGFQPGEYPQQHTRALALREAGVLSQVGMMTHFARADDDADITRAQLECFVRITRGLSGPVSVCNSAATLTPGIAAALAGRAQAVRPGICLYGASPFAQRTPSDLGLRPAMTLSSTLINVHRVPAGDGIGYGHAFRANKPMHIGIVACGYADGYPRHAGTGTPIVVDGVRTRLVGRVSMDMLAVDLDPVPLARPGSEVILWGQGGPGVDEVAAASTTIGYELLAGVAPRVPRRLI